MSAHSLRFKKRRPNLQTRRHAPLAASFEIVHDHLCPEGIALLYKLQMLRMALIIVLRLLRLEMDVQSNLVTLIHNTAIAGRLLAGVEVNNTGDGR